MPVDVVGLCTGERIVELCGLGDFGYRGFEPRACRPDR